MKHCQVLLAWILSVVLLVVFSVQSRICIACCCTANHSVVRWFSASLAAGRGVWWPVATANWHSCTLRHVPVIHMVTE